MFSAATRPFRYAGNPTIPLPGGTWYESQVYDFVVMVDPSDATKLVMYASGMAAPVNTGVQSIGRFTATVADPYTWTNQGQILQATETWELGSLRVGSMVYDAGTYYLFYSGNGNSTDGMDGAIGLATSSSPSGPFTKYASNPILTSTGQGRNDGGFTTLPAVMKEGLAWTMIYCYGSVGNILPGYRYATASSPTAWTKGGSGDILTTAPLYAEFHQFTKIDGLYYILLESGSPDPPVNYRIFVATSSSPHGPFTMLQVNPILSESGAPGSFDRYHVATPCLTEVAGRKLLFYCGAGEHDFPYNTNHWPGGIAEYAQRPISGPSSRGT